MRAELLLAQPNMGRGARLALRAAAVGTGLYGAMLILLFWNMNATLKREQAAVTATRRQAAEASAARRRKREETKRMGVVNVATPAGSGTAKFTEELYHLASASGAGMLSVMFTTSGQAAASPPPPPAGSDNANANNGSNGGNSAGNSPSGVVPVTPAAPPDGDNGWKRATFECNVTGSFLTLQDFLERLTRLPRVVEISGIELHRDPTDKQTRAIRVHLKLTGSVFGQADKP